MIQTTPYEGVTYTFDLGETSTGLYDLAEGESPVGFTTLMKTGTTGLMTVTKAGNWNSTQHGACRAFKADIAVAGNCRIDVIGCQFGSSGLYSVSTSTGTIVGADAQESQVSSCGTPVSFYYQGEAGSFTLTADASYTHKIIVTPIAEDEFPSTEDDDSNSWMPFTADGFKATEVSASGTYTFNWGVPSCGLWDVAAGEEPEMWNTPMKSGTVGLMTVKKAGYYHSVQHGACKAFEVEIPVAGDAKLSITGCQFTGDDDTMTVTASNGTIDVAEQKAHVDACGTDVVFNYVGGEGTITIAVTGDYTHKITLAHVQKEPAADLVYRPDRKIDVWDFGGVEEADTEKYENHVSKSFFEELSADLFEIPDDGKTKFKADGEFVFGDLTMKYCGWDRLYYNNADDSAKGTYSAGALNSYKHDFGDGYTSLGAYYCAGVGSDNGKGNRCLVIDNVVQGDVITAYAYVNNATMDLHLLYDGYFGEQDDFATVELETYTKATFVAQHTGKYILYMTNGSGKPRYLRVERTPGILVSGTIDMGECTDNDFTVKFINEETKVESIATVDGNTFEVILAPGYTYSAVMSGAQGWGFVNDSKYVTTSEDQINVGLSDVKLTVEVKEMYDYTGSIKGFAEGYDISKLNIELLAPEDAPFDDVPLTINEDLTFSARLEPDVEYTLLLSGVNDYEIVSTLSFSGNEARTEDIEVALKPMYEVTGGFLGLGEGAKVTDITFTNEEDGYTYKATVTENGYAINLRDAAYAVAATVDGYKTSTHVVVSGATVAKDLFFVSTTAAPAIDWVADIYVGYPDKANNYDTMTEAMDACKRMKPASEEQRITVHIAPGTYREQIFVEAPYVTFVNEEPDKGDVLLTWYYGIGYKYYSADKSGYYNPENAYDKYNKGTAAKWGCSVYIKSSATDFQAENIVFESSFNRYLTDEELEDGVECDAKDVVRKYGLDVRSRKATERASAIAIEGDRAEFVGCKFLSNQDTLYTGGAQLHSYFKNCFIEGNTDYIFGDGNVVFDNCELSFAGYTEAAAGGYITAARDEAPLGYLFRNCIVTQSKDAGQLHATGNFGRNWGAHAQVTFVDTKLERADMISAEGWASMSADVSEAIYKEYNTTALDGNAVSTSGRVANTVLTENPNIDVTTYFEGWTPANYVAEAETITFTTNPYVTDNGDLNIPKPGHTLTVNYKLDEASNANDASQIEWYRVKDGNATLVKTSVAGLDKTYQVAAEDAGCYIMVKVTPVTTSGKTGTAYEFTVDAVIGEGWEEPNAGADAVLGDGVNIFVAGDSTVKDYSAAGMYNGGRQQDLGSWGEFLQSFFNDEKVTVVNYANGGRSTRNFLNEGSLQKIADNIGEGDYLFMQFGHNDCADSEAYLVDRYAPVGTPDENGIYPVTEGVKDESGKYTWDCGGTYKWYLLQYINVAKEAGATPVVISPVARMYYAKDGSIRTHHDDSKSSGNAYCIAAKQIAEETGALFIDGYALTEKMYVDAYAADPNAANGSSTYGNQSMGDATHCNKIGGFMTAALYAQTLQNMDLDISLAVKMPSQVLAETLKGQTVFTVNGSNQFTAYGSDSDYVEKAEYWMTTGQAIIDAIGEKAEELLSGGSDTPGTGEGEGEQPGTGEGDKPVTPVDPEATMWVVGDSTVCEFNDTSYYYPRYGYGTQIAKYLDGYYVVKNLALSGRSSLSFLQEANYATIKSEIKAGDVLVVGFGHNDEKQEADRYTNPNGDYKTAGSFEYVLYENYVKMAQDAGAEVILCTPIVRRSTSDDYTGSSAHITADKEVNGVMYQGGDYAQAIRDLGKDVNVPVVDLTELTKALYTELGAAETLYLHAWTGKKETSVDNTHVNIYGAQRIAYLFAKAAKETTSTVASHVVLGAEPTKDVLVANPEYKEPEFNSNLAQSEIWPDYGIFKGTVFGTLGGQGKVSKDYYTLETDANGNMHMAALQGGSKISSTNDGFGMYYYKIPATSTFSFSAKATLNSDSLINAGGQAAFGLMARDDMYIDKNDTSILTDYVAAGTLGGSGINCFYRKDGVLNKGAALSAETLAVGSTYDLSIVSNSDGYACTFGKETTQTGGFDFALTSVDAENVYIGFFVTRNADVTFSDIKLVIDGVEVDITGGAGGETPGEGEGGEGGDQPGTGEGEGDKPGTGEGEETKKNGIVEEDGKFNYYVDGVIDTEFKGLALYENVYFYVENGSINLDYTGIVDYNGGQFMVVRGGVATTANGAVQCGDEWYFLANGQVQNVTQLAMYDGEWFVVEDGKLAIDFTGVYDYDGGKFYVARGRLVREANGLHGYEGEFYFYANGQMQVVTQLAKYDGEWFYIVDGKLASDFTGEVEYDGSKFNVVKGHVKF